METVEITYPNRREIEPGIWRTVGLTTFRVPVLDSRFCPFHQGRELLIDNPVLERRHWIDAAKCRA